MFGGGSSVSTNQVTTQNSVVTVTNNLAGPPISIGVLGPVPGFSLSQPGVRFGSFQSSGYGGGEGRASFEDYIDWISGGAVSFDAPGSLQK
ncbi:MAG: hypothetical protein C4293_03500 [Nitrospiraceae bacterium]